MTDIDVCMITAVVPACRRREKLIETLVQIRRCRPAPAEILVHVDGGAADIVEAVHSLDPAIRILTSNEFVGPGGSRNKLIAAAQYEWVANFDDDSFPRHNDYFARVLDTAARFPNAAMISAPSMESEWRSPKYKSIAVASGCGCVFRKSWFQRASGFVPLPIAYSMEEVDVSLQLVALGGVIVHDPFLRVLHNRSLSRKIDAVTNAHVLANTALFPYLRFPAWLWPVGVWQVIRRIAYLILHGWTAGLLDGIHLIPIHLRRYRSYRRNVSSPAILRWLLLRRRSRFLGDARPLSTSQFL